MPGGTAARPSTIFGCCSSFRLLCGRTRTSVWPMSPACGGLLRRHLRTSLPHRAPPVLKRQWSEWRTTGPQSAQGEARPPSGRWSSARSSAGDDRPRPDARRGAAPELRRHRGLARVVSGAPSTVGRAMERWRPPASCGSGGRSAGGRRRRRTTCDEAPSTPRHRRFASLGADGPSTTSPAGASAPGGTFPLAPCARGGSGAGRGVPVRVLTRARCSSSPIMCSERVVGARGGQCPATLPATRDLGAEAGETVRLMVPTGREAVRRDVRPLPWPIHRRHPRTDP